LLILTSGGDYFFTREREKKDHGKAWKINVFGSYLTAELERFP
jgi:hypothetical protein